MIKEPVHFKGKKAVEHVAQVQAEGKISSAEIHGIELPGYLSAGSDAARETAIFLLLVTFFLEPSFWLLAIFATSIIIWKVGRAAWLGWSRLERMHHVLEQEKWEIEHHRKQEREELKELYAAKGFEGKLLEDVLDVLMADGDRLLRVMVEEELGLTLESQEHPLQQGLGAGLGAVFASLFLLIGSLFSLFGVVIAAFIAIALAAVISSYPIGNRVIPAIVWTVGIAMLSFFTMFFLLQFFSTN